MFGETIWTTGSGKKLQFTEVVDEIREFLKKPNTEIIVGADSQKVRKKKTYAFVTVICCIEERKGAHYYYYKVRKLPHRRLKNVGAILAWKMWIEQDDIAKTCLELLNNEIDVIGIPTHHDLGYHGKSKEHIAAITGVMKSFGYEPVIKPDAFVASGIANKYSKY